MIAFHGALTRRAKKEFITRQRRDTISRGYARFLNELVRYLSAHTERRLFNCSVKLIDVSSFRRVYFDSVDVALLINHVGLSHRSDVRCPTVLQWNAIKQSKTVGSPQLFQLRDIYIPSDIPSSFSTLATWFETQNWRDKRNCLPVTVESCRKDERWRFTAARVGPTARIISPIILISLNQRHLNVTLLRDTDN